MFASATSRLTDGEYFREHVAIDSLAHSGCWEWRGHLCKNGYKYAGRHRHKILAHRFAYELFIGPIPRGMQVDHLCRNRICVNPAHLEPVPQALNLARGRALITHCPSGHPYDEQNTYWRKDRVGRECIACTRIRTKDIELRKRERTAP